MERKSHAFLIKKPKLRQASTKPVDLAATMADLALFREQESDAGRPGRSDQRNQIIHHEKVVIDLTSEDEALLSDPLGAALTEVRDAVDIQSDDDSDAPASDSLSWLDDCIEEVGDEQLLDGEKNACTLEEARFFRRLLREVGPDQLLRDTIEKGLISSKKLITAFGIRPPLFLEEGPACEVAYQGLLRLAFQRELSRRLKLSQYNSIDDTVELLMKSKNIIVLTGAGISTSLGIPDFRSKDVGLYAKLEHLGLDDPQQVFDIDLFRSDPSIFYTVAKDIVPSTDRVSPTHAFIRLLQEKGKLLTNYTQNIDNLEARAGIHPENLVQCHGSFVTASCIKCGVQVPGETIFPELRAGTVPQCKLCIEAIRVEQGSVGMKRKRSSTGPEKKRRRTSGGSSGDSSEDDDIPQPGVMKPDITFFGEQLPAKFEERLTNVDKNLVDLVIVIGTSLKVAPVSEVVSYLPAHVPQIYISRTPISHAEFDVDMLGDCDVVVAELSRRVGWDLQHEMIPEGQKVDIKTDEFFLSRHFFTEQKDK